MSDEDPTLYIYKQPKTDNDYAIDGIIFAMRQRIAKLYRETSEDNPKIYDDITKLAQNLNELASRVQIPN